LLIGREDITLPVYGRCFHHFAVGADGFIEKVPEIFLSLSTEWLDLSAAATDRKPEIKRNRLAIPLC